MQDDGAIRLGLRCVRGLRQDAGGGSRMHGPLGKSDRCARRSDDCGHGGDRFVSLDDARARARLRQDEVRDARGDRRARVVRRRPPDGALAGGAGGPPGRAAPDGRRDRTRRHAASRPMPDARSSPLPPMSLLERVRADYDGTGLTIGPHPMALVRASLATRGVAARARSARAAAPAGACASPARSSPASARAPPRGSSFSRSRTKPASPTSSSRRDVFGVYKRTIVDEPYLLVEGALQNQDGAVSVKVTRVEALRYAGPELGSHDFR